MAKPRNFMFQNEAAYRLGVTTNTLKAWRKAGRGPKWRTASRTNNRPLYDIDSVETLRSAFSVLESMGLRHANCAALPDDGSFVTSGGSE